MNKYYVSFEVARLLREKGYNDLNECYYNRHGVMCARHEGKILKEGECMAPRLDEAFRWLREERYIHITIEVHASGYYAVLWKTNGTFIKTLAGEGLNDGGVWNTCEEAMQAGILETLKLI